MPLAMTAQMLASAVLAVPVLAWVGPPAPAAWPWMALSCLLGMGAVASLLFITVFMVWQGKFSWLKSIFISAMVVIALWLMFEVWFKVPLPKGPLEALFGY